MDVYVNLLQWLIILAFFLVVIGAMFAEAFWISKKGWTNFSRAFVFSALSNFIGFCISFVVVFISFIVLLPFIFDDTASKNSRSNDVVIITVGIFAILFTPVFLMICKRIFLAVLKIKTGIAAWIYALASSILILVIALGVPTLLGYFIFR